MSGAPKYLVTGGTGFIGSALVRALVRAEAEVCVLDNGFRGSLRRLADVAGRIRVIEGDIRDASTVREAVRGVDRICHLAAVNGTEFFYTRPDLVLDVAMRGILNVIASAIDEGVREIFIASSSEVYQRAEHVPTDETVPLCIPDPLNPRYSYAVGKIVSEVSALNYGREHFRRVVIFRPHNVYGPDMGTEHVIPQFIERMRGLSRMSAEVVPFPIQGTGQETRAFAYIDDAIDAILVLLERGEHRGIYNIGTEEEVTIGTVATEVARYFGRRISIVPSPVPAGSTPRRCPDVSKLRGLGWSSHIPLRDGLGRTVAWYAPETAAAAATRS
jgi:dTDP-glucose 4,6-dehydratase/UDP-glucose 4-epimerase